MRKRLKKYIVLVSVFLFVSVCFSACSNKPKLEGYWVSGDEKYSVSFDRNGTIVIDDKYIGEYNVFDENKIAINVDTPAFDEYLDLSMSATYTIVKDGLIITSLETDKSFYFFTKEKTEKIINEVYREKELYFTGMKEFSSYESLGYFDSEGQLRKKSDWYIDEGDEVLCDYVSTVTELFENQVLRLHKANSNDLYYSVDVCNLIYVNEAILYIVELGCGEGTSMGLENRYAIDPIDKLIFVQDNVHDVYKLWDGTVVKGKSLLDN